MPSPAPTPPGSARSFSLAIAGSGGAGVMTAGTLLLDAAARAGLYGLMVRTSGPQIRGGEAAALAMVGAKTQRLQPGHDAVQHDELREALVHRLQALVPPQPPR